MRSEGQQDVAPGRQRFTSSQRAWGACRSTTAAVTRQSRSWPPSTHSGLVLRPSHALVGSACCRQLGECGPQLCQVPLAHEQWGQQQAGADQRVQGFPLFPRHQILRAGGWGEIQGLARGRTRERGQSVGCTHSSAIAATRPAAEASAHLNDHICQHARDVAGTPLAAELVGHKAAEVRHGAGPPRRARAAGWRGSWERAAQASRCKAASATPIREAGDRMEPKRRQRGSKAAESAAG